MKDEIKTQIKEKEDFRKGRKEQQMLKIRKQTLKSSMIEEQKLSQFNRMKILTHWRKLLRLAKTEQLKKEI